MCTGRGSVRLEQREAMGLWGPRKRPGAGESCTPIISLRDVSQHCVSWQLLATFTTGTLGNGTAWQGVPAVGLSNTTSCYQRCIFFSGLLLADFFSADDSSNPAKVVSAPPSHFLACAQSIIFLHVSNIKTFIRALSISSLNCCNLFSNISM